MGLALQGALEMTGFSTVFCWWAELGMRVLTFMSSFKSAARAANRFTVEFARSPAKPIRWMHSIVRYPAPFIHPRCLLLNACLLPVYGSMITCPTKYFLKKND